MLAGVGLLAGVAIHRAAHAGVLPSVLASAEERLASRFASRALSYPPREVAFIALKNEARLELWADEGDGWRFVRSYPIRAASGGLGPKLREGDHQVPEGLYQVAALNPNSRYHLSLRLDYPNGFDRAHASEEGRARIGGDIMIHGGEVSDGCVPVGDAGVEELFAIASRVGAEHVRVIVSPLDFRRMNATRAEARATVRPVWLGALYAGIAEALARFPLPADDAPAVHPRPREARARCKPYDAGDCVRRCRSGDVPSCARAGLMYADGLGVAPDIARAWSFLRQACGGGDALGCAELARLELADDGLRHDAARAAALAETACEGGDGHGCLYLARLCANRIIYPTAGDACGAERVERLWEIAVTRLRTDCRGWNAYDCSTLARMYYPSEPRTAFRLATAACESGDPGGCYTAGKLGEGAGDADRAARLYALACKRGYRPACDPAGTPGPRPVTASPP
jgi:TPR repeat protein